MVETIEITLTPSRSIASATEPGSKRSWSTIAVP